MNNLLLMAIALFFAFFLGYILKCMFCKYRNGVSGFSGKRLLVLLLGLIWAALSLWWYACKIKDMCEVKTEASSAISAPVVVTEEEVVTVEEVIAPAVPPLAFSWSSDIPQTTDEFGNVKRNIVDSLGDGDILRVVGQYYTGETNNTAFDNLGIGRAVATAKMLTDQVDESRIVVAGEDMGDFNGDKQQPFAAVKFESAPAAVEPAPANKSETDQPTRAANPDDKPVWFAWSSDAPVTGSGFESMKADLLNRLGANNALQIIGRFFQGEENTSNFANLGQSRAAKVRDLFAGDVDKTRLLIASEKMEGDSTTAADGYDAVEIKIIPMSQAGFKVKEQGNRRLVYFPFNSHDADADPNLVSYLSDLAQSLKESGKHITIIGYTDSRGRAAYNQQLGMQRARMIGDLLEKAGVDPLNIRTRSRGERDPIASNATEAGRAENRRAELIIE